MAGVQLWTSIKKVVIESINFLTTLSYWNFHFETFGRESSKNKQKILYYQEICQIADYIKMKQINFAYK